MTSRAEGTRPRPAATPAADFAPTVGMSAPVLDRIGSTRAGVWMIGSLISPFQRWVIRTTGGRVTLTSKPVLLLTTIGRRSRQPRTVPLLYLRDDDNLIVCNVRPPWERRNPPGRSTSEPTP